MMTQITLTTDQALLLGSAESTLLVRDPSGQVVGVMAKSIQASVPLKDAFTAEEIASAEREAQTTMQRHTTAEVLQRLDSLARQART